MCAFLEVRSWDDFESLVRDNDERWDDEINLYEGYSWEDFGREMFDTMGYEIPGDIEDYIDFEAYGESFKYDNIDEYSDGLIEIR